MKAAVFKEKGLLAVEEIPTPEAGDKQYVTCPRSALNRVKGSLRRSAPGPS